MNAVNLTCSRCSAFLSVSAEMHGKWVRCPRCNETFEARVPANPIPGDRPAFSSTAEAICPESSVSAAADANITTPTVAPKEAPSLLSDPQIGLDGAWEEVSEGLFFCFWILLIAGSVLLLDVGLGLAGELRFGMKADRRPWSPMELLLTILSVLCLPAGTLFFLREEATFFRRSPVGNGWVLGHVLTIMGIWALAIALHKGQLPVNSKQTALIIEFSCYISLGLSTSVCLGMFLLALARKLGNSKLAWSCLLFVIFEVFFWLFLLIFSIHLILNKTESAFQGPVTNPFWWIGSVASLAWGAFNLNWTRKVFWSPSSTAVRCAEERNHERRL